MKALVSIVLGLLLLGVTVHAQTVSVSQVSGTVKDRSGAVLPGAMVKVTQTETGLMRSVLTDESGFYNIPNLPVGPYRMEISLAGFSTHIQTGIVLQVNSNPTINAELVVGSVSQQVEVQGDVPLVETRSTGVGQVIENRRILELPLNGRQATELILLSAGSLPAPPAAFQSSRNYPTITVSVGGGSAAGLFFVMDGGDHNDPHNNLNLPIPFPDSLEEFKVETSAVSARYGYHAAGVVNLVTKSGSNSYHGSAFEFVRNGIFNARNPFALTRDTLKRNQFGGTFGGPIIHNKLFFFGGYQQTITRSDPNTTISFVPSQAMLNGDFTAATLPACNSGKTITLKAPFVGNMISPAAFNAVALKYEQFIPVSSDPCGKIQYGIPAPNNEKQGLGKIDYLLSNKHTIFGRYFYAHYNIPYFFDGKNALTTAIGGQVNIAQSFVLGDTYSFTPNLINSFRATVNRTHNERIPIPFHSPSEFGVQMTPLTPAYSSLIIGNGFNIGGALANLGFWNSTTFPFADDVDYIRGSHQFSFGVSYIYATMNAVGNQFANGQYTFNGQNTGLGLADFLLGLPSNYTQGFAQVESERANHFALYVQDAWKVKSRLTLNYGLRWEPWFPMYEARGHVSHFDLARFNAVQKSTVYPNAPAGLTFPGDPGFPGDATTTGKMAQFAPRLGVVYDLTGRGTQVIRVGYGIFYDLPAMYYNVRLASAPPWGNTTGVNNTPMANPWQGFSGGDPFTHPVSSSTPFPPAAVFVNYPVSTTPTNLQQWNIAYQRQMSANWGVTVSYVGNKTTHLWLTREVDPAVYIPGGSTTTNTNQRRVLFLSNPAQGVFYSNLSLLDDGGNATYHGLLVSVEKRFSHGFSMFANYTWSHCLNEGEDYEALGVQSGYQNPNNRVADRGDCASDRRHSVNVSQVWDTPRFNTTWLRIVASGWQLSTITKLQSGDSFTVSSGLDNALTGTNNQRPNMNADPNLSGSARTLSHWFATTAFTPNGPGLYGTAGRGIIRGPGMFNINLAVVRNFRIGEHQNIEARAEAFNVLNHIQPNDPTTTLTSPLYGKITTANDPRIMQFALKYLF